MSLSGGQKARVALARGLYSNASIYLLDDPLSAVDTAVGKHLFHRCIRKHLAGRIRILVTHQMQFLKDMDHILVIRGVSWLSLRPKAERANCSPYNIFRWLEIVLWYRSAHASPQLILLERK